MAPRRKQAPPPEPAGIRVTPSMAKWVVGFLGAVLTMVLAWWAVSDRIVTSLDARWRLEQVQAAKDKEQAQHDKQVDDQIKNVAKRAEVGRAWVMFNVIDGTAKTAATFTRLCKGLKLAPETCNEFAEEARGAKVDAAAAKAAASAAGATGKD